MKSTTEVTTDGSTVRIIQEGQVRTLRASRGGRSLLLDGELEWFLRCGESALGLRGTTASVVSMIERGGASGAPDFDAVMLQRIGWSVELGRPGHRNIERARKLSQRWVKLAPEHQRVAVAHYLMTPRAPGKVAARFGELAGVVVWLWNTKARTARARRQAAAVEAIRAEREPLAEELARLSRMVRQGAARLSDARRSRDAARAFREQSRLWLLWRVLRPLRSAVEDLQAREATEAAFGHERGLEELTRACERGEPPGLREQAERAVVAAHRAWTRTGQVEADAWVEAP
jgi:hypothetical protein